MTTMLLKIKIGLLTATVSAISFAAAPVARVISTEPVNVDGIVGPARNYVPLSMGNEVTTEGASAVIQFNDGSAVTLQPHSTLRIEGQPSAPVARVLRGSAIYDTARPAPNPINQRAGTPVAMPSIVPAADSAGSGTRGTDAHASAPLVYRAPAVSQPGGITPQGAAAFTGTFQAGGPAAGAGGGPQILAPNGLTINLTATVNPTTGATTYTVSSIQQTITTASGGTAVVTVTTGSMIGATVGGISTSTFTFTPPGSTTPLTPTQTATAVQTGVQQAITAGVQNGTLPAGTQPPAPAPVVTGGFSASGH